MEGTLLIAFLPCVVSQSLPWPRLVVPLVFGHRLDSELSLRGSENLFDQDIPKHFGVQ